MKRILLLFCLLSFQCFSQKALISDIKYSQKDPLIQYIFPEVALKKNSALSKKINDTLRSQFLFAPPGCPRDSIFNQVRTTADHPANFYDISYETVYNSTNFLSLILSAESCGMYCEPFVTNFNFDLKTGNLLSLDSIFTQNGLFILTDSMNYKRALLLNKELESIRERLKTKEADDPDKKSELEEMLTMYSDCASDSLNVKFTPGLEFFFKNGVVTVCTWRCSAHYNMSLDELWVMEFPFELNYWEPYLTPYGKKLIKN